MSVILAKTAGYCFGVDRAVKLVEEAAGQGSVVTLGSIIHNRFVVAKLRDMGVQVIDRPEDAPAGATVVIRAHGVGRAVMEQLAEQGNPVVDATCPYVKRIHRIVEDATARGRNVLILGQPHHPEAQFAVGETEASETDLEEKVTVSSKETQISIDNTGNNAYIDLETILPKVDGDERELVILLAEKSQSTDELIERSQLPASRVMASLTLLEVQGIVRCGSDKRVTLIGPGD